MGLSKQKKQEEQEKIKKEKNKLASAMETVQKEINSINSIVSSYEKSKNSILYSFESTNPERMHDVALLKAISHLISHSTFKNLEQAPEKIHPLKELTKKINKEIRTLQGVKSALAYKIDKSYQGNFFFKSAARSNFFVELDKYMEKEPQEQVYNLQALQTYLQPASQQKIVEAVVTQLKEKSAAKEEKELLQIAHSQIAKVNAFLPGIIKEIELSMEKPKAKASISV
ncbi:MULTISPECIES: hypothetical protein [Legionella]|uniref:Uncharacterized protein n=1 Tax=Legionella septentrionalis TaxID=2498109 RepID=A0A433JLM7_9GAMM|nr:MULTISPECIES: hypothetical protein [Legionella]MCP0914112.1 hypothetical protein [Legionella sp. 27cVA30]RUQ90731.1 hypothetical protein EKM59_01285 [Legionella septentrionalis]RUR10192.1 hypothetical protein ELY14_05880 [Legionella septentrionalis]